MLRAPVKILLISLLLFTTNAFADYSAQNRQFSYIEFGPAFIDFRQSIDLDAGAEDRTYRNLVGFRFAGAIQTDDNFFFDFNYTLGQQTKGPTDMDLQELRAGAGAFASFGPEKATSLVGKAFYYGLETDLCSINDCSNFKEQGFGFEASAQHQLTSFLVLEAGTQYLITDVESFPAYRLGALLTSYSGHGINASAYFTKDLPNIFSVAYRYTF